MKRVFDLFLTIVFIVVLIIPFISICFLIKITSRGSVLYWSRRVGINNKIFLMPKFRTMKINTPDLASHELENPNQFITSTGLFLRKYSLDEIPQLYSVLFGDMSFVGPRPALFNQYDLIDMREKKGVSILKPGITGWAQINGRDELSVLDKVKYDEEYLKRFSFFFDVYIILKTPFKVFKRDGITH